MAKMDEALSNIFRSICKKKPAGIRKKEMMDSLAIMHFKIRALDMVNYIFAYFYSKDMNNRHFRYRGIEIRQFRIQILNGKH